MRRGPVWEYALAFLVLSAIAVSAAAFFYLRGYTLYYGDAEAHLNTARKMLDSRNPGYEQIGTVWLPLLHVLLLPFVRDFQLWHTGLAGSFPGVICVIAAGMFLFSTARGLFGSFAAAAAAALCFLLNPNLLYLASSPMTEAVFFMALFGLLLSSVRFAQTRRVLAAGAAGFFSCLASLTRYDGWFLIPFVPMYFLLVGGEKRWKASCLFCALASAAVVYWMAHNWILFGDPLDFYRGPYSAKAINNGAPYPGYHDWGKAVLYFRTAGELGAGTPLLWIGGIGCIVALAKRIAWPVLLLFLAPVFYVLSMYSSGNPIFVPNLWPNTYYNTRYGLAILPLLAFGAGAFVTFFPERIRAISAGAAVLLCVLPWIVHPSPEKWICWKESQVNSEGRRAWTHQAARYLGSYYRAGDGLLFSFGDLTGVLREAGIPLREAVHTGNNPAYDASLARPDLFLHYTWALAMAGDPVATAIQKIGRTAQPYVQAQTIIVKNAPVIEIYRRPPPSLK